MITEEHRGAISNVYPRDDATSEPSHDNISHVSNLHEQSQPNLVLSIILGIAFSSFPHTINMVSFRLSLHT